MRSPDPSQKHAELRSPDPSTTAKVVRPPLFNLRQLGGMALLIAITVAIYYWITRHVYVVDFSTMDTERFDPYFGFLALGLASLVPIWCSLRWLMMLYAMDIHIDFRRVLGAVSAGYPINLVTPSHAGDLYRAYILRNEIPWTHTVGSVSVERLLDLLTLSMMGALSAFLAGYSEQALIATVVILAILTAFTMLFLLDIKRLPLPRKIKTKATDILQAARLVLRRPRFILLSFCFSTLQWGTVILVCWVLLSGMGSPVPFLHLAGSVPLSIFVGLLPFTFGGMGTRDAVLIYLLKDLVSTEHLILLGICYGFLFYLWIGILGIFPLIGSIWRDRNSSGVR